MKHSQKVTTANHTPAKAHREAQADRHVQSHALPQQEAQNSPLGHVTHALPPHSRAFSKFIHMAGIEQASDILGATLGRPFPLLLGGVFALIGGLALYGYAKYAGFALQGSEVMLLFAAGWALGIIVDIAKALLMRRRG